MNPRYDRIEEARGAMSRPELARRLSRRNPFLLGTTSAQQVKRWEGGQRMRYEAETFAAIAAELKKPYEFFFESEAEAVLVGGPDDEEPSTVVVTVEVAREQLAEFLSDNAIRLIAEKGKRPPENEHERQWDGAERRVS